MLSNFSLRTLIYFSVVSLLLGCTQKMNDVGSSLSEAFSASDDVTLSQEEISSLPYASTYLRINDGRQVFMVLAFADLNPTTGNTRLKWVSADGSMIATEQGRIVKTLGFDGSNLINIAGKGISTGIITDSQWNAVYDWSPDNRYQFSASVNSTFIKREAISTNQWTLETNKIDEHVNFGELNKAFTNSYWITDAGETMKSIQYIGPNMNKFEMTILKTFAPAR
ncbi:YjbF family lipoprotein [Vibrio penaeicida]|nr:YjbF family lipoprotein [Vibrio penaeicida]RTZ22209.1 YjbF family lipoprotein [Vibrio penaeicida]